MDAAAADYLALSLDGTDVLLMAADHALRRELSRRIRDDLIRLGIVRPGPRCASPTARWPAPGDLIVCTRNDHTVEAGEPGRTLANGDLLRIDAVTPGGLIVRRALDADPATGQRRWTGQQFLYADYRDAELGYAVTDHVAQSRTVTAGLAVIAGTEDRQHAYVALTRGTDINMAYVFTVSPKLADPAPGPRPAPELARYDRITAGRAAQPAAGRGGRRPGTRSPCWPACWTEMASSCPPPRPGSGPWPTPITWRSCTRSGPTRPPRPASSTTGTCSWPACHPSTGESPATRPDGCGAPCAPPNWPGWTPARYWPPRSATGTWPGARDLAAVIDARHPAPARHPHPGPGRPVVGPDPAARRP